MYTATKQPGKFQANRSELLADVLNKIVQNGDQTDEIGDCDTTGHYARIEGKRFSYLLETDSNGFATYQIVPKSEIEMVWQSVLTNVMQLEEGEGEGEERERERRNNHENKT